MSICRTIKRIRKYEKLVTEINNISNSTKFFLLIIQKILDFCKILYDCGWYELSMARLFIYGDY